MTSRHQDSDEELRLYLLGKLPHERREQLEAHLLSDPTLHDELVAAEDDLVDDYLAKKLSDQERQQFETAFAITAQRQHKVLFGQTFRQYLESRQIADPQEDLRGDFAESPSPRTESGFFGRKTVMTGTPAMILAVVIVLCLGVTAVWWLAFNRTADPKALQPTIAVTLRPGTTRSAGVSTQKISKPPANSLVGFKLELGRSEFRTYRAELLRETESLASFGSLTAQPVDNHFEVEVIVATSLLEDDEDYRFKLSGVSDSGQLLPAEEYGFRVSR